MNQQPQELTERRAWKPLGIKTTATFRTYPARVWGWVTIPATPGRR